MRSSSRLWIVSCSAVLSACVPPAPSASPEVSRLAPVSAPVAQPQQPDLSPVAEPANLVAVARVRNANTTFEAAMRLAKLPGITLESLLAQAGKLDRFALFKLDASVDVGLALDPRSNDDEPKFLAAVSIPLRHLEETRAAMASNFLPVAPGVYRGILLDLGERGDKASHCDLSVAVGDAPARLVCADSDPELEALRPWLTRGLPLVQAPDADLRIEVKARALQQRYVPAMEREVEELSARGSQWLQSELNVTEPELLGAPGEVLRHGQRLATELDTLSLEGTLLPASQQLSMRGTVSLRSADSWFSRALTHRGDRTGPLPPIFWRVPKDAESAMFGRGEERALVEGIHRVLQLGARTLLARAGAKPSTGAAVDDFLAVIPDPDVLSVSAAGPAAQRAERKQGPRKRPAEAVEDFRFLVGDYVGWWMVGLEAPSAQYASWLKRGATAMQALVAELREKIPSKTDRDWLPAVSLTASPPGYPKSSLALDIAFRYDSKLAWSMAPGYADEEHPAGAVAKGTLTLRIVMAPDGPDRTWIGVSTDASLLRARLASVMRAAPDSGTLANRSDLEPLKRKQGSSAGFLTYGSALNKGMRWAGRKRYGELRSIDAVPNQWKTPVLLVTRGTSGPAPTSTLEVLVQQGTVEDFLALVRHYLMGSVTTELSGPVGIIRRSPAPVPPPRATSSSVPVTPPPNPPRP